MNIEDFFNWVKENPSQSAETLTTMCSDIEGFEFASRCKNCNYSVNGMCRPELLAEEIENL